MLKKPLVPSSKLSKKNRYKVLNSQSSRPLSSTNVAPTSSASSTLRGTGHYYKGYTNQNYIHGASPGTTLSSHNSPSPTPQLYLHSKTSTQAQPLQRASGQPESYQTKYKHSKSASSHQGNYAFGAKASSGAILSSGQSSTAAISSAYDQFYKSQDPGKHYSSKDEDPQERKMIIANEELNSGYSYKKKAHHKKSASTLSPEVTNMLGKYVTTVGHNFIAASGNNTPNTSIHQNDPPKKHQPYHFAKHYDRGDSGFLLQTPQKTPTSSYIVQIHQHQHQHQYHYHLNSQTNPSRPPSRPESSKIKQPNASMVDAHQLKMQLESKQKVVAQSQAFQSHGGTKKGLHMRTKSDHLFSNLPSKSQSALKNNYVKSKATAPSSASKYTQSAFKKKPGFSHMKTSSEVPQLPLHALGKLMNETSESTFQTPKLSQQSTMYQGTSVTNLTPNGSNSQRMAVGSTVSSCQRKSSLNLQIGGSTSKKSSSGFPLSSNVTPNFKTGFQTKKRASLTSNSPVPHPSYSQHVTPKSNQIGGGNFMIGMNPPQGDQEKPVYHHGHHLSMMPVTKSQEKQKYAYSHKRSTSEGINDLIMNAQGAYPAAPISGSNHGLRVIKRASVASKNPSHSSAGSDCDFPASESGSQIVPQFKNIQEQISYFAALRIKGAQSTEPTLEQRQFKLKRDKKILSESNISIQSQSQLSQSASQHQGSPRQNFPKYSFYIGAPDQDSKYLKKVLKEKEVIVQNSKNIRSTPVSSLNSLEMMQEMSDQEVKHVMATGSTLFNQNAPHSRPGSSYARVPSHDGDEPRPKMGSVREAYGLPKESAGLVQQIGDRANVNHHHQHPEINTDNSPQRYTFKKESGKYKSPVPPPSDIYKHPVGAQYVRRKSQSITSQKEIEKSQQLRKANPTQGVTSALKSVTKKKETKHKPTYSLALSSNIQKYSTPNQNKSARGQTTPQNKPGFVSKIPAPKHSSSKLMPEGIRKETPVQFKKSEAIKMHQPVGLLHSPEPIDLTPSPLALGQAGQTIQNLLPRQQTTASAVQLSPRSKNKHKLTRYIRAYFERFNEAPQTTADFYRIGKMLGRGAFGKVNLALHKLTNELVAIKSMNKTMLENERSKRKVMQEITILKRIRHPHIVNLFETFETKKHILFVMELCAGGDLLNYVRKRRRLKEPLAKFVFLQIVSGLHYCHLNRILHRDIKLDNILLDAFGHVKICDFGVSKIVKRGEKIKDQCGTPAYIAPQILLDKGYEGFTVDIWSAGVVLYAMLYGTVPFKANNMSELHKMIIAADYTLKDDISESARDLLKSILQADPAKRFTMTDILEHPWMQDIDNTLTLFTESEKQIIRSQFTYNDCRRYNRNQNSDIFTEHPLDTEANELERNVSEKSIILAPFNSTKSHISVDPHPSVEDLVRTRQAIRFGAKVREINRQYEQNNNQELDNGVYNKFVCEEREQELLSPDGSFNSPRSLQSPRIGERRQSLAKEQKGEIEKLQIEGMENLERLKEFEQEAKKEGIYNIVMQENIDEEIIDETVEFGYPRDYIKKCLKVKDANHATTTYYLLQTLKAGFAFNNFKEMDQLGLASGRLQQSLKVFEN